MNPPENISDRIEKERKSWLSYSFSEEHLPKNKDEVKEETQIPIPPPPPPRTDDEVKKSAQESRKK